jgi:hypothetical protein
MASISPGNKTLFLSVIVILILGSAVSGQSFNDPPPLLYNKLAPLGQNQDSDIELTNQHLEKKSIGTAFFLSLMLPGLGEAYVGRTGYTKVFLSIEAVGWGLFVANEIQVASRREDYKNYASQHANLSQSGKDDQYWIDIGKYDDIFSFNEQRRRERNIDALYTENSDYFWQWDEKSSRLSYDGRRIGAAELEERRTFIIGGIILNHLVSAINALRVARIHNRELEEIGWRLDMDFDPHYGELSLGISKSF